MNIASAPCACTVMPNGKLLRICKLHFDWVCEVAAQEREACAKIAEDLSVIDASIDSLAHADQRKIAAAIRARHPTDVNICAVCGWRWLPEDGTCPNCEPHAQHIWG